MNSSPVSPRLLVLLGVRQMRTRVGRAVLTMFSVVIGVAGVVAVTTATSVTRGAYRDMYSALAGRAAIEIVSDGGALPQSLVDTVEQLASVRTAAPLLQRPTTLYHGKLRVRAVILGVDPERDKLLHDFVLNAGVTLEEADGAVLDASFARSVGISVGDEVKLFTRSGIQPIEVVGLVTPRSVSSARLGGAVWLWLETAQELTRSAEQIDTLQVVLNEGVDEAQVRRELPAMLPPGATVRAPDADVRLAEDHMLAAVMGLNVGSMYTLLGAAFIILNTFVMNVTDRRRELGILRAIGATRGQVMRLLLGEGLLLGAAGTALGIALGLVGAAGLIRVMERLFETSLPGMRVEGWSLLAGAVCGLFVSLLATFFPARRAAAISPVEAMRRGPGSMAPDVHQRMLAVGVVLWIIGGGGVIATLARWVDPLASVPAGLTLIVAVILIIPSVLPLALRSVGTIVSRFAGPEGRIAERQLLRWRVRTALTVGVVYAAIGTGIGLGNSIINGLKDVRQWTQQTIAADFIIRGVLNNSVTGASEALPDDVRQRLAAIPRIARLDSLSFTRSRVNETSVLVIAREFSKYNDLPLDVKQGDAGRLKQNLQAGQVAIGTVLAERMKLHAGDELELGTEQGPRRVRVAAVITDYQVGGMLLAMDREPAEKLLGIKGADALLIRAEKGALQEVDAALQQLCQEQGLILQSYADVVSSIDGLLGGLQAGLWAILALQFLVAGFGIANTLTMNVLEQTREIGLLRVVGMTRRQVRRMIFTQAGLMGLVSLLLGLPGGIVVAWVMNICAQPVTGQQVAFTLHPSLFLGGSAMALLIVLVAALFPAERAVRLEAAEAMAYE